MSVLRKIKDFIGNIMLQQELKSTSRVRKVTTFKFDEAKTVGILFDAASTEDFELIKRYVAYLRENSKKVKVIGYFKSSGGVPTLTYAKLDFDFFSSKEVSLTGKPSPVFVRNFIEEEYDLLIDLNINDHFPLKYIAALSKASFKVGKYEEDDIPIHDMMIDSDHTKTIKYFLKQIDTYITMLNKVEVSLN
jgi:hypothetical protein